jgi:hypothetical protein
MLLRKNILHLSQNEPQLVNKSRENKSRALQDRQVPANAFEADDGYCDAFDSKFTTPIIALGEIDAVVGSLRIEESQMNIPNNPKIPNPESQIRNIRNPNPKSQTRNPKCRSVRSTRRDDSTRRRHSRAWWRSREDRPSVRSTRRDDNVHTPPPFVQSQSKIGNPKSKLGTTRARPAQIPIPKSEFPNGIGF